MINPIATYRIQFSKDFNLADFGKVLPYLKEIGVGTLYASPVFEATPGSSHGYDVTDPHSLNPEIGTLSEWEDLRPRLDESGIAWLQDIVPNHMAYNPHNSWLMDVFEKGDRSAYYSFFDIDWDSPLFGGRLMAPFLGKKLEDAVREGELKITIQNGRLTVGYYESSFPIYYRSYSFVLQAAAGRIPGPHRQVVQAIQELDEIHDPDRFGKEWEEIKAGIAGYYENGGKGQSYLEACLRTVNQDEEKLRRLLEQQRFVLTHWKETEERINYRRFFTINGLICLRMEEEKVFQHYHRVLKEWIDHGMIQGLRIDHIDGLKDPVQYLNRLRKLAGKETYIVVEKILESGEKLPSGWPVQGSTGYEFLADVNNLFSQEQNEQFFKRFYQRIYYGGNRVEEQVQQKKKAILNERMAGEKKNLFHLFQKLELTSPEEQRKIGAEHIKKAIGEFLIRCSVYRFYGNEMPLPSDEAEEAREILEEIKTEQSSLAKAADLLHRVFLENGSEEEAYREKARQFYMRCMQFTGPLMAKGVEDTLMYIYNQFVAHNEVGDSPGNFGISAAVFHRKMQERQERWPLALNATSTHDTKRGEDARARLNALSEFPEEWKEQVKQWKTLNDPIKGKMDGRPVPDENDEYLIYQTLLGVAPTCGEPDATFLERMQDYLIKAVREAMVHSSWSEPNESYEQGSLRFLQKILSPAHPFWSGFFPFMKKIAAFGKVNSLSQVLLKFTSPGVPDVYQGCELWDFSLVDPDNRRPVDYELRQRLLGEAAGWDPGQLFQQLREDDQGKIKLWLIRRLFRERKNHPELFRSGEYLPLQVKGKYRDHILAFARRFRQDWYVTAVPIYPGALSESQGCFFTEVDWLDTRILLPGEAPTVWENRLTGKTFTTKGEIPLASAFSELSYLLLKGRSSQTERGAGVLLHITSLPSKYGMGDLGPGAYRFADFLFDTRQKYWQVLPLNPVTSTGGYSPYSSFSGFAGNPLLLSPERLAAMGLLSKEDLSGGYFPESRSVDFPGAEAFRRDLFLVVYKAFKKHGEEQLQAGFAEFCRRESHWLEDYSLYVWLKEKFKGKAWHEWPEPFRDREEKALAEARKEGREMIEKEKILQFLFYRQWKSLKEYCNDREIRLIGDLPFYICYDSADVWKHPEYFSLDEKKKMTAVAGVPPDYFNENGQLWGMPVYRWEVLKKNGYDWWIRRLKKNLDYFDLLRLDHFRAFCDYWEVSAGEPTAINGEWKPGPGRDFFDVLKKEIPDLPFIAEDLGDITEEVYELRDHYHFPGMKVLQFAFSNDSPRSVHILHNYDPHCIVYTGTHDNNTTKGWYVEDLNWESRKRLSEYAGIPVTADDSPMQLIRLAYSSVGKTAIIPMQDFLGLGPEARMNKPATHGKNWIWKLTTAEMERLRPEMIAGLVERYYRY